MTVSDRDGLAALAAMRNEMRELVRRLSAMPPVDDDRTGPELRERYTVLRRLRRRFAAHETAVQQSVWPLVRRHDPGAHTLVRDAVRTKKEIEEAFVRMDWMGDRDHARNREERLIANTLDDHLTIEESLIYQVGLALDTATLDRMGRRVARTLGSAPTRSHPDLPAQPQVARVISPLVAVVDRIRDRLAPPIDAT